MGHCLEVSREDPGVMRIADAGTRPLGEGEERGQEREPDVLSGGIESDRARSLLLGKPAGGELAADREGGRLEETDQQAQPEEGQEGAGKSLGEGGDGTRVGSGSASPDKRKQMLRGMGRP